MRSELAGRVRGVLCPSSSGCVSEEDPQNADCSPKAKVIYWFALIASSALYWENELPVGRRKVVHYLWE